MLIGQFKKCSLAPYAHHTCCNVSLNIHVTQEVLTFASLFRAHQTLPSIEEAWRLPIPAELTSRQGSSGPAGGLASGRGAGGPGQDQDSSLREDAKKKKDRKRVSDV